MKVFIRYSIFPLLFVLVLNACQHEPLFKEVPKIDPTDTTGTVGNSKVCDPDTVYFTNDILPLLQSNCAFSGCHGNGSAQDGVELSNYRNVINTGEVRPFDPDDSEIYEAISESDPDKIMPPPPYNKLSSEQINLIAKWINQGALDNACDPCDTINVTYSQSIQPLVSNYCQGCHSGNSPSGNIRLTNHLEIQSRALNGSLLGSINHQGGYTPMPYNQPKLLPCQIDQVRIWIEDGALDN